jgi:hypothetical protein
MDYCQGATMKRKFCMTIVVTLGVLTVAADLYSPHTAAGDEAQSLRFLWSFCALTGPEDQLEMVAITKDTVLHSGDRVKIFFQPESTCYIYVLYTSSEGLLTVLFPAAQQARALPAGEPHYIPAGDQWFRLDGYTGPETFYLMASKDRLDRLEEQMEKHRQLSSREDLANSTAAILAELKTLRRQHLKLAAPAERPVRLGGNLRGTGGQPTPMDVRKVAVEITAQDFFSRTFTIDHR